MKDSLYLKKYVQMHPDNKMGWYLLGKEYEKNGEEGKANYCFNQSSEVYEAFEHSKVPDDLWEEYQYRLLQLTRDKEWRSNKARFFLLALMMMFLIFIPTTINAPGHQPIATADANVINEIEKSSEFKNYKEASLNSDVTTPLFTARAVGSSQERARILSHMLSRPATLPVNLVVLGLEKKDQWLLWKSSMPIAYTLKRNEDKTVTYQSYNPAECQCEPSEDSKVKAAGRLWIKKQEDLLILAKAIRSFAQQEGRPPVSLSELVQPFPRNWISGSTEVMKNYFGELNAAYASGGSEAQPSSPALTKKKDETTPFATAIGNDVYFKEPIEIIVDTLNHRLAVVSGNIMLRNYKVGLGGSKTPIAEFVITDKVVNPNGKSNGEFGSRGMQLSDSSYAIHGTNEPDSIGRDESNGCVRMSKEDVEELFDLIPMGTKVRIVKGALPDGLLVPTERYQAQHRHDQTNPRKTYHWL